MELTRQIADFLFRYDPSTGELFWRSNPGKKETLAGCPNGFGYLRVKVRGKQFFAHRIAWLLVHGDMPKQLDHVNGVKGDNRLVNLRPATYGENGQNRKPNRNNTSGYPGVSKHRNQWVAQIRTPGGRHRKTGFTTAEKAFEHLKAKKAELHTFSPEVRLA